MKRQWHIEELEEHFTLLPPEIDLLQGLAGAFEQKVTVFGYGLLAQLTGSDESNSNF